MATNPTTLPQQSDTPEAAIEKVAKEFGVNPAYLSGLARLETAGGSKTIKGGGVDTFNLFNIKGKTALGGINAKDLAEGSDDPYRRYSSYEESARDLMSLLQRRYPKALTATNGLEFATALKAGGYATDPKYIEKLSAVIGAGTGPAGAPGASTGAGGTTPAQPATNALGAAVLAFGADLSAMRDANPNAAIRQAEEQERAMGDKLEAARKSEDETGFFDAVGAQWQDGRFNVSRSLMRAIVEAEQPVDPDFDYYAERDKWEKNLTQDEREYMRENATRSAASADRALAEIMDRRETDKVLAAAGPVASFAGALTVGIADPVGWAAGLGVMKAAQLAKVGSTALALQGRTGAALASVAGEAAVGELAIQGIADLSGEVYSFNDYTLAAAGGGVFGLGLAGRGVTRTAAHAQATNELNAIRDKAFEQHQALTNQAIDALGEGPHTPQAVQAKIDEIQLSTTQAEFNEATSTAALKHKLIDDADAALMKDEFEGVQKEVPDEQIEQAAELDVAVKQPDAAEPELPAVDADDAQAVTQSLSKLDTAQEMPPVAKVTKLNDDGDALTVKWQVTSKPKGEKRTVVPVLEAVIAHSKNLDETTRVAAARMLELVKANNLKGGTVKIQFGVNYKRGWFQPSSNKITSPSTVPADLSLNDIARTLNDHGARTIVHEISHALTHANIDRIAANPTADAEGARILTELAVLQSKLAGSLQAQGVKLPQTKKQADDSTGAVYGLQNLHEFAAQVFSDFETQQQLARIKTGGSRNGLKEFIKKIGELIGIKGSTKTALDDALDLIDQLITLESPVKPVKKQVSRADLLYKSPEFIQWFGDSRFKEVNEATGLFQPKILYHGTSAVKFSVFQPKQAGAAFVTPEKMFAKWFEDYSLYWYLKRTEGVHNWRRLAFDAGKSEAEIQAMWQAYRDAGGTSNLENHGDLFERMIIKPLGGERRTIPLFVRAEKTWDYENPDDVRALAHVAAQRAADKTVAHNPELFGDAAFGEGVYKSTFDYTYNLLKAGDWRDVESAVDDIKALGYDSFAVTEAQGGVAPKNIAVFNPNQLKHALENNGDYSVSNDDIYASPKPAKPFAAPTAASSNKAQTGKAIWLPRIIARAKAWDKANPIDQKKLNVITARIGANQAGLSDGLKLARSSNPVLRMFAALGVETTTGAAGRRQTVAIDRDLLNKKYVGHTIREYGNAYHAWAQAKGNNSLIRFYDDAFNGDLKREFDNAVYTEVLNRRDGLPLTGDSRVRQGADALERSFERMRIDQKEVGTLGSSNLPDSSVGYVPQALDGQKMAVATGDEIKALKANLEQQFLRETPWDAAFAKTFADFYVERARSRAMGEKGIDGLAAQGDGLMHIHELLTELGELKPDAQVVANKAKQALMTKSGLGQTKARLKIDLREKIDGGRQVMDFYNTDPLLLMRQAANRTAGNVALTKSGILGQKGLRELRAAATAMTDGSRATQEELNAFDRVAAELLGTPVNGAVVSAAATNLRLLVSLQRLGGMAFTQAAENWNALHHVGLNGTLKAIGALPRMLGELRGTLAGRRVNNPFLSSMETLSGAEFGTENHLMVAPLDAPDARMLEYGESMGLGSRLLNAGVHAQAKISLFRAVLAAQHRAFAEQITLKALRYIDGVTITGTSGSIRIANEGSGAVRALRDMGFTDELVTAFKRDLAKARPLGPDGRPTGFNIMEIRDAAAREAFIQAVHRGTSQIIQGTYIGERGLWAHNDYLKLMLQLRTFGLTAVEKQWGRTRMNHGVVAASGLLLTTMAMALPLHLARVQLASVGMDEDKRRDYLENQLSAGGVVKALMNYSALSGFAGDILEILGSVAGGWIEDADTQKALGIGQQGASVGRLIPAAGTVDSAIKAVSGKLDARTALKQAPFSNIPYVTPAINFLADTVSDD